MRTELDKQRRKEQDATKQLEYQKYYTGHPTEEQKCKYCGQVKPLLSFIANYFHRTKCKECAKSRVKLWRRQNPEAKQSIYRKSFDKTAEYIKSFKQKPCAKCNGLFPPCALDFHHKDRNNKLVRVSNLYQRDPNRVDREVAYCELICANCHRDETQAEVEKQEFKPAPKRVNRTDVLIADGCTTKQCTICKNTKHIDNFTKLKSGHMHSYCKLCMYEYNAIKYGGKKPDRLAKKYMHQYKEANPCADCGKYFRYWKMDLDHVRGEKITNVSKMQMGSPEKLKTEIAKCDVVCACCHRVRTFNTKNRLQQTLEIPDTSFQPGVVEEVNLGKINIETISINEVTELLEKHHYAGYGRPASIVYKAVYEGNTIAIVKFTPIAQIEVATSEGWEPNETLELDRFCIIPRYQVKNAASRIMSLVIKQLRKNRPEIEHIVSFTDPGHRHVGTIHEASNWKYIGTSATSYKYMYANGREINKRTLCRAAKKLGMTEREYAIMEQVMVIRTPGKNKFVYELR
jgi:hypothetical protein